jgi:uncharacterized membrane protein YedE/YeeE
MIIPPAKDKSWSPYLAGALTGLLIIITTWFSGIYFGASTSFVRAAGYIARIFSPEYVSSNTYFQWFPPVIDWQFIFVLGIFIGAFLASITSRSFKLQAVPDMWESRFGSGGLKRGLTAFIGGVIALFGAKMAGGCPSGFGLGALVQLGLSGLIAFICFFIGGILVARILYPGDNSK